MGRLQVPKGFPAHTVPQHTVNFNPIRFKNYAFSLKTEQIFEDFDIEIMTLIIEIFLHSLMRRCSTVH